MDADTPAFGVPASGGSVVVGHQPVERVGGHPILRMLVAFPIVCFSGALLTDIAYALSADMMWADFSAWLLAAAMFFTVVAVIAGIVSFLTNRRVRPARLTLVVVGSVVVLVLGMFDNLVHSRDAWTSVVPAGLALSFVTVVVVLLTAWFGSAVEHRPVEGGSYSGVRQ